MFGFLRAKAGTAFSDWHKVQNHIRSEKLGNTDHKVSCKVSVQIDSDLLK